MRKYDTLYKNIGEMTDTELKHLGAWTFECATGTSCKLYNVKLLESSALELWFRVGVIYFIVVQTGYTSKAMFTSNEHKEKVQQF